jgi:hydroxypyruvate reductase
MSNLTQLRLAAREIFDETLLALDAGDAVRRAVHLDGLRLNIHDTTIEIAGRKVYSIATGKAAIAMTSTLEEILEEKLTAGVISSDPQRYGGPGRDASEPQALLRRHTLFHGGHPEPNEQSLAAALACFKLLERANEERALVIFLISGGGSAMLEWPIRDDITLADLRAANKVLVNSGASIGEIGAVRRAFSAVKDGRLAARAPNCERVTLLVSDVPAGEERNVASGPSLRSSQDAPDARDVIARYNLSRQLPEIIVHAIETEPGPPENSSASLDRYFVLLDNRSALEAAAEAARRLGFVTEIAGDISDQPIAEGCAQLLGKLAQLRVRAGVDPREGTSPAVCLISGGEFACPVKGDGTGGRNQETALRLASLTGPTLSAHEHFVALCAGTDGIDGNSPAAGAIVDNTTVARACAIALDPQDFLERSDAYLFFVALGDAIATGPTGTNVCDIRILLASSE